MIAEHLSNVFLASVCRVGSKRSTPWPSNGVFYLAACQEYKQQFVSISARKKFREFFHFQLVCVGYYSGNCGETEEAVNSQTIHRFSQSQRRPQLGSSPP